MTQNINYRFLQPTNALRKVLTAQRVCIVTKNSTAITRKVRKCVARYSNRESVQYFLCHEKGMIQMTEVG